MFNNKIVKVLIAYVIYFLYSVLVSSIIQTFKIPNEIIVNFIFDILFLIGIVAAYRKNIKKDWHNLKEQQKKDKWYIIKTIIFWVFIIFIFNIIMGMITDFLLPQSAMDANTDAMVLLMKQSLFYTIFKTMIFAIIAEELLFRESIRDVVKNKFAFIFISATVYTAMNCIFSGFTSETLLLDILTYFLPALIFSFAYVKNNSNILILMGIKMVYNFIPLIVMLTQ